MLPILIETSLSSAISLAKIAGLLLDDGQYQGTYYFPADGHQETFSIELKAGEGQLLVPRFKDDVAIIIRQD